MKKSFLIEVPHENTTYECYRAVKLFMDSGSHFLANAKWGCPGDDHRAILIVDVETREQALQVVPPMYRSIARITETMGFTPDDMEAVREKFQIPGEKFHRHDS
jgi:hypothetical protein